MGPNMVVMFHPLPNDDLGFLKPVEDLPIQKIVSEGAIKAFTKAILPGATGFNISSFDPNARQPTAQVFGNKFWTVITSDVLWDTVVHHGVGQLFNHLDRSSPSGAEDG